MRKNKSTVIGYRNVHNSILAEGENMEFKISKIDEHYMQKLEMMIAGYSKILMVLN